VNSIEAELVVDTLALTRGMRRLEDSSYKIFFSHYYRRLWAYLAVLNDGQEEELEEILQEVFEKVVLHIKEFEEEGAFWAWLATIAKNTYRDSQRKKNRLNNFRERLTNFVSHVLPATNTLQVVDNWTLEQAMTKLSDDERRLIYSKYFIGESYREIAGRLCISEKAVELRLSRARHKLRELMIDRG